MAKRGKSKRSWKGSVLRTALVAALSIAIWTFAEARSLTTSSRTVTLAFAAPAGLDRTAWVEPERDQRITATVRLEGSRAALQRIEQRFASPIELLIGDALSSQPGVTPLSLREALRNHPVFDRAAVSLLEVSPPTIEVRVDEVISTQVPVRVRAGGVDLQRPVAAEPASVTVRGPATLIRGVAFDVLEAPVPGEEVEGLTPGSTTELSSLAITIPAPWRTDLVEISPGSVSATIVLRDTIQTLTLSSVPVMVRLSPTQLQRWSVRVAPEDAYLRDVVVRGPSEAIDAIRQGRQRVVATLWLEGAELVAGQATFEAQLSAEASGLRFEVADRSVPIEVIAIDGDGGQDGGAAGDD